MKIFKLNTFQLYLFLYNLKFFLLMLFCGAFVEFFIIYSNMANASSNINIDKLKLVELSISYLPIMVFKTINYIFFFSSYGVINKLIYTYELIGAKSIGMTTKKLIKPFFYNAIIVSFIIYILSVIFPSQYHKHKRGMNSISYDSILKQLEVDVLFSMQNVDILFEKIENNKDMVNLDIFYNNKENESSKTIHMGRANLKFIDNQLVIFGEDVQIIYTNKDGELQAVQYVAKMDHPIDINVKESVYNKEDVRYLSNYKLFKYCKLNYCNIKKKKTVRSEISYRINTLTMMLLNLIMIAFILNKTIQRNREYKYDIYAFIILFYTTMIKINYSLARVSESGIFYSIIYLVVPALVTIAVIELSKFLIIYLKKN